MKVLIQNECMNRTFINITTYLVLAIWHLSGLNVTIAQDHFFQSLADVIMTRSMVLNQRLVYKDFASLGKMENLRGMKTPETPEFGLLRWSSLQRE